MAPYIYYDTTFDTSGITPENVLAAYTKGIFPNRGRQNGKLIEGLYG